MGISNRPLEAAFNAGTQRAAKPSESIHARLAKTMRSAPHQDETNCIPKFSLRKMFLRTMKRQSAKCHQPPALTPPRETYRTEGIVFSLLSRVPIDELSRGDDDQKQDDDAEQERQPRTAMDLGLDDEILEEFRRATMHTITVELPCDIWKATVLRRRFY